MLSLEEWYKAKIEESSAKKDITFSMISKLVANFIKNYNTNNSGY